MSDLRINNITDRTGDSGPVIAGVSTVSSGQFVVPVGPTEFRGGRGRGVFSGGDNPVTTTMDYIDISSTGNAADFGDNIDVGWGISGGVASSTRGTFASGYNASGTFFKTIQYTTISSQGGTYNFGDLTVVSYRPGGASNSIRGLYAGHWTTGWATVNSIDYITIASTGDALDFGDLIGSLPLNKGGAASPTRALFPGGNSPYTSIIDYVEIATRGDSKDFGDITSSRSEIAGCSSSTRAVFGGGVINPTQTNIIEYNTFATLGNSIDFGDLTLLRRALAATSNGTRGVFGGGFNGSPVNDAVNIIDYVTIASAGNATDFGDLSIVKRDLGAVSDSHGGLG